MKYHGMKAVYGFFAFLFLIMIGFSLFALCSRWPDCDAGIRSFLVLTLCAAIAGFVLFLNRLFYPAVYTEFRADGLHVLSREAGELGFIDWNDVKDCRSVSFDPMKVTVCIYYTLLILQWDAKFGNNPISVCRKYRQEDVETITEYRLDEQMKKLAEGTMSAEEFRNLPYLFLVTEGSFRYFLRSYDRPTEIIEKLWRARRRECGAAENRETGDDSAE